MRNRAREIVEVLDSTVPVEDAGVILLVDDDWESDDGYCAPFLATPAGFVRFGLQFMKAAISASTAGSQEHPPVDVDVDQVLRSDSAFEVEVELLPETPSAPPPCVRHVRVVPRFPPAAGTPLGPSRLDFPAGGTR